MKQKITLAFCIILIASSCSKSDDTSAKSKKDLLTSKTWLYDTVTINPPATLTTLQSIAPTFMTGQQVYYAAHNYNKGSFANFLPTGQGTTGKGSNVDAFTWRLLNNDKDLELTFLPPSSGVTIFKDFYVDANQMYYVGPISDILPPSEFTFRYK